MSYSTADDIRASVTGEDLIGLTDDEGLGMVDEARVGEAIARADAEIDSLCGLRYRVPFSPVPEVIRKLSVDLAVYDLYARLSAAMPEARARQYREARALLEAISNGSAVPGTDMDDQESGPGSNRGRGDNVFSRDALGGF